MARCTNTADLEVHHKRRDGGNKISNAQVLCKLCHVNTSTYGVSGESPEPFTDFAKIMAKFFAGFQCECEKGNCH